MSTMTSRALRTLGLTALLATPLGACAYDYTQHTDRVGYSAGNAVKANLEMQTSDPARDSAYVTTGLGRNGNVQSPTSTP